MRSLRGLLAVLLFLTAPALAKAATITETYTFNLTYKSGGLTCEGYYSTPDVYPDLGETTNLGYFAVCPGYPRPAPFVDSFDEIASGQIDITSVDGLFIGATCSINGWNCNYNDWSDIVHGNSTYPLGPNPGGIDLGAASDLDSYFYIYGGSGTYNYHTNYDDFSYTVPDGDNYYLYNMTFYDVLFDLSDITYSSSQPAPVPLPAGLPLLGGGLISLVMLRRRRIAA